MSVLFKGKGEENRECTKIEQGRICKETGNLFEQRQYQQRRIRKRESVLPFSLNSEKSDKIIKF